MIINPWINFNDNAEEAFDFYKSVFGGEVRKVPNDKDNMLIANNVPEGMGRVNENENRSKIAVSTESKEEAEKIFSGLSSGGNVEVPMSDGMGLYIGMFRD